MSRQALWAHNKRDELISMLGGCCAHCRSTDRLEFHHTGPRTWVARKKSRWMRAILYRRDIEAGIIRLLCRDCHEALGGGR